MLNQNLTTPINLIETIEIQGIVEIKIITIKISLIEKMIILIKTIEGNIKNQTLNLTES
jgi:hypothetical protein